jgi:UDP-N-acetylmuramate--alanine ligase
VVFQPHLYSRTRDFADGFAKSLDKADEVILMDIYPARELPMEGVTSAMILERMKNSNKKIVSDGALLETLSEVESDVFLTVGAGDIDRFVYPIKNLLEKRI